MENQAFELNNLMFDSFLVLRLVRLSPVLTVSRDKGKSCPDLQRNYCTKFRAPLGASLPTFHCHLPRFLGP